MPLNRYVSTMEIVMNADPADDKSWSRIYGPLSRLRSFLLCDDCVKLLEMPQKAAFARCVHNYCRICIIDIKPQCEYCVDQIFQDNFRLRLILQFYKRMCRYISASGICRDWEKNTLSSKMVKFNSMIYEGASLHDRYDYSKFLPKEEFKRKVKFSHKSKSKSKNKDLQPISGEKIVKRVKLGKQPSKAEKLKVWVDSTPLSEIPILDYSSDEFEIERPKVMSKFLSERKRKKCICGMAIQNRGLLTRHQVCPCCFIGSVCTICSCGGCTNPQNFISNPLLCLRPQHESSDIPCILFDSDSSDTEYMEIERRFNSFI